ncbi:glycosyltransferase family 4 protein [Frankia sp. AgPm24]|uniref:glycosyltransferase family 4 protein n=1 Tax=Frankia sp. AgPm24 TaxID=631128 RepID=UPI00200F7DE6|nr:glycosyltransferase family 4 protein [Frankia sp. AgPm24]MCK9925028.1 glycosyltransferase family 4 protein [Frankia sp. AgPm24]
MQVRKILMVTPRFFPDIGGIETHVFETARRLNELPDLRVEVLTTDQRQAHLRTETIAGVAVTRVPAFPRERDYLVAPRLVAEMKARRPDLVHVQGAHTAVPVLAMSAAVRAGVPYILTPHTGGHSSRARHSLRASQWRALGPLVRRAHHLVCVARFEAEMFTRLCHPDPSRVSVIQNGVETFSTAAPIPDNRVVVSVGRFERYKGQHRLIAAMPELLRREPQARLVLIGRGPYEAQLRRQAAELGLGDRVAFRFIPPTDREDMSAVLRDARAVALLSDYEAHPVAVMEAVATGRPVLVSATSGLSELAERGLARTVAAPDDAWAVAGALHRELTHPVPPPKLALPSWDDCARSLRGLYLDVPAP